MEIISCGRFKARERTTQGKYSTGSAPTKKGTTASTGVSSTVHASSKATVSTHSEYELPEVKAYPGEVEKTGVESGTSTFKQEHPQSEGNDDLAVQEEATAVHAMPPQGKEWEAEDDGGTPIKARIQRYSTKCVGKHQVERHEVDFGEALEEDDDEEESIAVA